ncbi:hypothetical protein D3C71_956370 [compost metagenome]
MHVVEVRQIEEGVALEQLDAAAGIGGVIAQHARADGVGPLAGPALGAAVLAVDAPAGKQLDLGFGGVARGQQLGNIGRIVLAIAVERGDPCRTRGFHARAHRRALAALLHVVQHPQLGVGLLQCLQHLQGVVAGIVVHIDDFERQPPTQRGGDFIDQRRNVVALVEDGDNHRKEGLVHRWIRLQCRGREPRNSWARRSGT